MKLVTKAEFARMIEMSPSSVTTIAKGPLAYAMVNNKIDMGHEDTINFLNAHNQPSSLPTGIDPFYQQAVDICIARKKISVRLLKQELGIGQDRADAMIKMIRAGIPDMLTTKVEKPKKPTPTKKSRALERLNSRLAPPPPPQPVVKQTPPPPPVQVPQAVIKQPRAPAPTPLTTVKTRKKKALAQITPPASHDDPAPQDDVPEDINAFADFTLREIIARYGSDTAFVDFLKATKMIEDIAMKRLQNAKTAGEQVSIDLVRTGVIEPIDAVFRALLTDGAKTIATTIVSMTKSNATIVECELKVIQHLSKIIKIAKQKIAKAVTSG